MQQGAVLDYGRTQRTIVRRVRDWARRQRRSIAIVACLTFALYAASYRLVRESHTKFWFDKETENRVPYTLFDAYSRGELCMYVCFLARMCR